MKSRIIMAVAVALALGVATLLGFHRIGAPQPAPAVAYTLIDGTPATLDQSRGKVVLVNFWATSCSVCVKEMPQIVSTHRKYAAMGFETLAVAMSYDPPARVVDFAASRQLPFRVAMDHTGSIAKAFGDVQETPTSVLINRRGEIVKRYVGEPDFDALHRLIEALLEPS